MFGFTITITRTPPQDRLQPHDRCAEAPTSPDTPLVTELFAALDHTHRLGWLASREQRPAEYRHLATALLSHLVDGWRAQTGGHGTVEDLLPLPNPAHRQAAADSPLLTGPVSRAAGGRPQVVTPRPSRRAEGQRGRRSA
ncbi:hypothetical protein K7472_31390 [Streptomyces sp. PTM05]|uniref:Uncharacterized protein n=1 Tax=Streptantibioticus parmotrematis TaxID=2873249 RepID=A0ABS7R1G6_9ACTN|nr:hypothetical protein [Streptantibioticus parmotrematis]MBY8889313.1 hypothetical protein [Streptantibioticus parmotrematis]